MAERGRTRTEDVLDLARVLLLVQGALLIVSAIEAAFFGAVFGGAAFLSALPTAAAALIVLVTRARLRPGRARLLFAVEVVIVLALAVDVALAIVIAHRAVPLVMIVTQFVLPLAIIASLTRLSRPQEPA